MTPDCTGYPPEPPTSFEVEGGRWVKVCQSCWQDLWPDQYVPELTDTACCALCEDLALVVSVNPKEISKAKAEQKESA